MHRTSLLAALVAAFCVSCVTAVPATREHPQVGCWFDTLHRFVYALIVDRDAEVTTWVPRQILSTARNPLDREERVVSSKSVRPGYCPDETKSVIGRERDVWRQPDADHPDPPGARSPPSLN
jgi:hypothetical protein